MRFPVCQPVLTACGILAVASCAGPMPSSEAPPAPMPAAHVCDPLNFGAKADGLTKDTAAIQAAIDACSTDDGGVVVLSRGRFLSGTIRLHSHQTLRIEARATLLGSRDDGDYPTLRPPTVNTELNNCKRALVYAERADHVRIEGGGTDRKSVV